MRRSPHTTLVYGSVTSQPCDHYTAYLRPAGKDHSDNIANRLTHPGSVIDLTYMEIASRYNAYPRLVALAHEYVAYMAKTATPLNGAAEFLAELEAK